MNLKKILNKKKVFIISPHSDDAVLSCGSLISQLSADTDVSVVNVFTKAHSGPYTLSALKFLKDSGNYHDAVLLFQEREKEDKKVLAKLNAKVVNLGLTESMFRLKKNPGLPGKLFPELCHLYPTYRWHIVKKIAAKDPSFQRLMNKLEKLIPKNSFVLAPYGIGNHADHLISRLVCEDIFDNLTLYSDFPYNFRKKNYGNTPEGYKKVALKVNLEEKNKLLKKYRTQFFGLFPKGEIPNHQEVYFIKENR